MGFMPFLMEERIGDTNASSNRSIVNEYQRTDVNKSWSEITKDKNNEYSYSS